MREPRCNSIVQSKNLWEIAIEFLGKIDTKLMEQNLKQAYITYKLCRLRLIRYEIAAKLIFLACFNEIGKFNGDLDKSDEQIETYLFLKYFSPVLDHADVLLFDNTNLRVKDSIIHEDAIIYRASMDFTKYLIKTNNALESLKLIKENYMKYDFKTIRALEKLVKKQDVIYEFNSVHFKTVIYKYISRSIFNAKDKNKFITMLSSLFEMYSAQTLYHSKLTAIISYMIAKYMKLKNKQAKKIYIAALCHDLGKVCIPLKILEKPDKLTDREYSTMKKHVTFTKEILNGKMDYEIIEMAYRHHEKLDGSGYPNKLKAEYITIDQRILQVSDIISALIAKRSYKEAWDITKTISILDSMSLEGKIDKDVVECFKKYQTKILKASYQYKAQADKLYEKINKERDLIISKKYPERLIEKPTEEKIDINEKESPTE